MQVSECWKVVDPKFHGFDQPANGLDSFAADCYYPALNSPNPIDPSGSSLVYDSAFVESS